jgi:serine/threonine protein kinase
MRRNISPEAGNLLVLAYRELVNWGGISLNCGRFRRTVDTPGSRKTPGNFMPGRQDLLAMVEVADRQTLGPYLLTRDLEPNSLGERFLALHAEDQSSHVAYRCAPRPSREGMSRFVHAIRTAESLRHEHVLSIEYHTIDGEGCPWIVTPFTGDVDGVRTLGKLLREKEGQMQPFEAERALVHILEAAAAAHRTEATRDGREARLPLVHGPLTIDEILVDRHGRLVIELYGLARLLSGEPASGDPETVRDELRSIAEIGYQLVTGLRAEVPMIPASRLVKRLDPRWDMWLSRGLDPVNGFESAEEALGLLPSRQSTDLEIETVAGVRGVFGRLRPSRW